MIQASYKTFPAMMQEREYLEELISIFQSSKIAFEKLTSQTPVQIIMVPGNNEVKELSEHLQRHNLDVRPILSPTVPKGKERLRVVLHAFNTKAELELLIGQLK